MRYPEPFSSFLKETLDIHEGSLELELESHDGDVRVRKRKTGGQLSVSRPLDAGDGPTGFYLINTSGGIIQGDRLSVSIKAGKGCKAALMSQSANKIYGMEQSCAIQTTSIELGDDAYLEYVPEPNIPYAGSRFFQASVVRYTESSTLLYWDVMYPGRYGRGEEFDRCVYFSRFEAFDDAGPTLVDTVFVDPERRDPRIPGIMGDRRFYANVYARASDLSKLEKRLKGYDHCVNASGLLVVRMLENDSLALRRRLEKVKKEFRSVYY